MELPYTIIRLLYAFKVSDALAQREIIAMLRYFNMSCQIAACFQPFDEVKVEILEQKEKFFVGTGYPPPFSPISVMTSWPARASMAGGHNRRDGTAQSMSVTPTASGMRSETATHDRG